MILISLQPYAFKKIFLLVAALVCLSSALCFADPLFMTMPSSAHERQMNQFHSASSASKTAQPSAPLSLLKQWVQDPRNSSYSYSLESKGPAEASTPAGPFALIAFQAPFPSQELPNLAW